MSEFNEYFVLVNITGELADDSAVAASSEAGAIADHINEHIDYQSWDDYRIEAYDEEGIDTAYTVEVFTRFIVPPNYQAGSAKE